MKYFSIVYQQELQWRGRASHLSASHSFSDWNCSRQKIKSLQVKASPVFCCNPSNGSQDGANTGGETKFSVPACEVGFARYLDRDGGDCGHGRADSEAQ